MLIDDKRRLAARRAAKPTGRPLGGIAGLALLGAILTALAVSTYLEAPPSADSSRGEPSIHWGGR